MNNETPIGSQREPSKEKKSVFGLKFVSVAVIVFILVIALVMVALTLKNHFNTTQQTTGKVALTEGQLRDIVKSQNLVAYWAGSMTGAKYTLTVSKSNQVVIRYLPDGVGLDSLSPNFREIATYPTKNAFATTALAGRNIGNVGFTNADGNSVFYTKARPTNVHIGIKGKDIQVEIFDPTVDQSLGLALIKGQVSQIN